MATVGFIAQQFRQHLLSPIIPHGMLRRRRRRPRTNIKHIRQVFANNPRRVEPLVITL